jgi:competence protein ComEC
VHVLVVLCATTRGGCKRCPAARGTIDSHSVTRLAYGQASLLLTGDMEARVEERLLADGADLRSTVLKVAHHGACTSSTEGFLEAVAPEVAVISVGADNDFDHPCDEVLERLQGRVLYRTNQHRTVDLVTDGARLWVNTEHATSP